MKRFLLTMASLCMVGIVDAQTPQQIDAFKNEVLSAWHQNKPSSFDGLFLHDSAREDLLKRAIASLREWRDTPGNSKIDRLVYLSKTDCEEAEDGDSPEDYLWLDRTFEETTAIVEDGLCQNVPIAGVLKITVAHETMIYPVGVHGDKMYFACARNATEKEKEAARVAFAKQRHVNKDLLLLRRELARANKEGKQLFLIVVNKGDHEHLMINGNAVSKEGLKEFFIDVEKSRGAKVPLIIVDCRDENSAVFALLKPVASSYLPDHMICLFYADTPSSDKSALTIDPPVSGGEQPSIPPNSK